MKRAEQTQRSGATDETQSPPLRRHRESLGLGNSAALRNPAPLGASNQAASAALLGPATSDPKQPRPDENRWVPRDLSDCRSPAELRERYAAAKAEYDAYAARNNRAEDLGYIQGLSPLFTYSAKDRMREALAAGGLRVSYGADNQLIHQRGSFPQGLYGTTIEPWRQDMHRGAMRLNFFDHEYSMPSVSHGREEVGSMIKNSNMSPEMKWSLLPRRELLTDCFVSVAQSKGWAPNGRLEYSELRQPQGENFIHYSMPTPQHRAGAYVPQDIIAYGVSLIPDGPISGALRAGGLARANSEPSLIRLRTGPNLEPVPPGNRPKRRFSVNDGPLSYDALFRR